MKLCVVLDENVRRLRYGENVRDLIRGNVDQI